MTDEEVSIIFDLGEGSDGGSRHPQIPPGELRHSCMQATLRADEKVETGGVADTANGIQSTDSLDGGEVARMTACCCFE